MPSHVKAFPPVRSTTNAALLVLTTVVVLFARRPDQFLHPYIWVEDGLYILKEFTDVGFWTLTKPLAGYFLLVTKLISVAAYRLSILWAPEIELVLVVAFTCGVIAAIAMSPTHLRWPWLCALATLLIPSDAETFAVSAYAFWWSGPLLLLALLWDPSRGGRWLRWLYVVVGGLSSPIIGPITVLLWLRAGFERRGGEVVTAVLAALVAATQVLGMLQQPPTHDLKALTLRTPLDLLDRFVADFFIRGGPPGLGLAIGLGVLALAWFLRKRLNRYFVLLVLACGAISVIIPVRLPAGQFQHLDPFLVGPRYFFYPFICLSWILIWLARESSSTTRAAIGVAWLVAVLTALPGMSRRHDPIDWKRHVLTCAGSDRYEIPIHYDGQLKHAWHASFMGAQCRKMIENSLWRATDLPVPRTQVVPSEHSTVGVFRSGQWFLDLNANGSWDGEPDDTTFTFGGPGDVPVVGDWSGGGRLGVGIFRAGQWLLVDGLPSRGDRVSSRRDIRFGETGDIPVVGRWSDGPMSRIGVFRNGTWLLDLNGNGAWDGPAGGDLQVIFGQAGDLPVVGDWSGSGRTDIGVYRKGRWLLDANGNRVWDGPTGGDLLFTFGEPTDLPIVGHWDRSKVSRIGTFRNGHWYLDANGSAAWDGPAGGDRWIRFGAPGDVPIAGGF
jgi:hypothetical protein